MIDQAFDSLERHPVVLGPSCDGGYYLVGMRTNCQEIFEGIPWSTSRVLEETIARLNQSEVGFELLPEMSDVDDVEDLARLMSDLNASSTPADAALLNRLTNLGTFSDSGCRFSEEADPSETQP